MEQSRPETLDEAAAILNKAALVTKIEGRLDLIEREKQIRDDVEAVIETLGETANVLIHHLKRNGFQYLSLAAVAALAFYLTRSTIRRSL